MLRRLMLDHHPDVAFHHESEFIVSQIRDTTEWSINSVWAFLSEKARVTVFGCNKDGQTLATLLNKGQFKGVLVSDNAAVYQGFDRAQKCWAHLLRKAIKLTPLKLNRPRYRKFLESLLDIYRRGRQIAGDKRLNEAGRRAKADHWSMQNMSALRIVFATAALRQMTLKKTSII